MKKINILILPFLLLLLLSCSDTDHNPWLGQGETPEPIKRLTATKDVSFDSNWTNGSNVINDSTIAFVFNAPNKENVHWISDFTFWKAKENFQMNKERENFWIQIQGFEKNKEYAYQYLIANGENELKIADPYATKTSDPNDKYIAASIYPNLLTPGTDIRAVISTAPMDYKWNIENFKLDNPNNMVIYEMLLRDFTEERSIKAAMAKLPYLKALGVNAIELMPFNEFEGNDSWGYNPSFYFAADKAYGTELDYKTFVDECHKNGMAVLMDMVFNHAYRQCPLVQMYFDSEKNQVTADNPWFNVEAPHKKYSWGYDFNHESDATKKFIDDVTAYWMTEYKIDGFRFDFTKGFTNKESTGDDDFSAKDESRIAILQRMTDAVRKVNKDAIVIFEHLAANEEEKILAEYGIYLWGNMNRNFMQATMGWEGNDLNWSYYGNREWTKPQLISYMESHDEERLMFENLKNGNSNEAANGYDVKQLNTALTRSGAAAVIYFTIPGPKMIWQFGELGYDYELNDDELAPKPVRWDYYDVKERKALYDVYASMLKLRQQNPTFTATDVTLAVGEGLAKQVLLKSGSGAVCTVANFDVVTQIVDVNFGATGEWIEHFTQSKLNVTTAKQAVELKPGEYRLYIK